MIKCCNEIPDLRILYRYNIAEIMCEKCNKHTDIKIPKHIPQAQYEKYVTKKYNEIIKKEEIMLNILVKGVKEIEKHKNI